MYIHIDTKQKILMKFNKNKNIYNVFMVVTT